MGEQKTEIDKRRSAATWFARAAFLVVFAVNVWCALSFCIDPGGYAGAYELSGVPGTVAVQGIGVAFLMWNCTYPPVIIAPRRFRALSYVVVVQQLVGLVGESIILSGITYADHAQLFGSILRFIAFDGVGLALMLVAVVGLHLTRNSGKAAQ